LTLLRAAVIAIVVLSLFGAGSLPGLAADDSEKEYPVISDRFVFGVGGFLADFSTDAAVGSGNILGTFFRAEDLLNLSEDKSTFRLEGFYRFKPRHGIGFGYWGFSRDGVSVLTEQLMFQDVTYDIDALVSSDFKTSFFRVYWRYAFLQTNRGEAGINLGLSNYKFDINLSGIGQIDDGMGGFISDFFQVEEDILAPVPTIGFFLTFGITPHVVINVRSDWFNLEIDTFDGTLLDTQFTAEWWITPVFALGAGINGTRIDVANSGTDPWRFEYNQAGLVGYIAFAFGEAPGN
jgi:hypothetical protein